MKVQPPERDLQKKEKRTSGPLLEIVGRFTRDHKGIILKKTLLSLANYPLEIVGISTLTGRLFDALAKISSAGNASRELPRVAACIGGIGGIYLATETVNFLYDRLDTTFWPDVNEFLRKELLSLVWTKARENDTSNITGEVIAHILKIPYVGDIFFDYVQKYLLPFLLVLVTMVSFLLYIDRPLGLVTLALISSYMYLVFQNGKRLVVPVYEQEDREFRLYRYLDDILQNTNTIFSTNSQERERGEVHRRENDLRGAFHEYYKVKTVHNYQFALLNVPLTLSILAFAFHRFRKGFISRANLITVVMVFLFYLRHIHSGIRRLTELLLVVGPMLYLNSFLKSFQEGLRRDHDSPQQRREEPPSPAQGTHWVLPRGQMDVEDVSFRYSQTSPWILKRVSLTIEPGELVALTGTSGSGKSTLCRMIMGYIHPSRGRILFDGQDVLGIPLEELRYHVTYMSQDRRLFHRSFYENMTYGVPRAEDPLHRKELVRQICDFLESIEGYSILPLCDPSRSDYRPENWDRSVGNGGSEVSGGQAQLILLVRAFLHQRKIIVLDEPTTGIDIHHVPLFVKGIRALCKEKTAIMISHDPRVIELCTRVITMKHGEVLEDSRQQT